MIPTKMATMGPLQNDYKKLYLPGIFFFSITACAQPSVPGNKKAKPVSNTVVKDKQETGEQLVKLGIAAMTAISMDDLLKK